MRHYLSQILLGLLIAFLVLLSAAFAWMRSSQLTITQSPVVVKHRVTAEEAITAGFQWERIGAAVYTNNCAKCHGADGRGWDQYPGMELTARQAAAPGGRDYLIDLHLHGLTSDRWRAPMPTMRTLSNSEIAAVINYVMDEFSPKDATDEPIPHFLPSEVEARREHDKTPREVNDQREGLGI